MNNDFLKKLPGVIITIYSFFTIAMCMIGGTLKDEWRIDGGEIKDVCDVLRVIVIDDYRGTVAIFTLALITPVILYAAVNKFKLLYVNALLLIFSLSWVCFFIIKYKDCLWL